MPTLALRYAAASDLGRYRKDNQDSAYAGAHLLMVADGVGGAAYGDVASHTAAQIMAKLDEPASGDALETLAGGIHRVHDRLAELVEADPELDGTSTTISAGLFDGEGRLAMAHLGDSRAYLLHEGALAQITHDHTFVQSLVDEGRITDAEARVHPHRNLILRAVDGVHDTQPDLFYVELVAGDRLLFCSDGASGVLDDEAMARLLAPGTPDLAAAAIIRAALDAGTTDNVTVVVADIVAAQVGLDPVPPLFAGAAATTPRKLTGEAAPRERHRFRRAHEVTDDLAVVDPEELRYALRPPRRSAWWRRLLIAVVVVALVGVGGKLAYDWTQKQYYVADNGDYVAVYRGVDLDLPLLTLHTLVETSSVSLASLPELTAQRVHDGISKSSLGSARQVIDSITELATTCPATPTTTLTKKPTQKPAKKPHGAASSPNKTPTKAPTTTPTPTPTPTLAPPDCIVLPTSITPSGSTTPTGTPSP